MNQVRTHNKRTLYLSILTVFTQLLIGGLNFIPSLSSRANGINTPPVISGLPGSTTIQEDDSVTLDFTVSDDSTLPGDILLFTQSYNPALIPDANIVLGGSGENRSIQITSLPDGNGTAPVMPFRC